MSGSIAAELLVLRKRASTWILLAIWAALTVFFGYFLPYLIYRSNSGGPFRPSVTPLLPQQLVSNLIESFPFYGGAIVLILGVMTLGSEYGWGTLKTLFTLRPGRLQILAAKMVALAIALIPFVLVTFIVGAICSLIVAQQEQAAIAWPDAWLFVRAIFAGWFILAVWATFGATLAVLFRGTAMAVGIGILYALAIEGLVSALANQSSLLRPLIKGFFRANAYSLVRPLSAVASNARNGPGAFAGPYVESAQAFTVLALYLVAFLLIMSIIIHRRDVA